MAHIPTVARMKQSLLVICLAQLAPKETCWPHRNRSQGQLTCLECLFLRLHLCLRDIMQKYGNARLPGEIIHTSAVIEGVRRHRSHPHKTHVQRTWDRWAGIRHRSVAARVCCKGHQCVRRPRLLLLLLLLPFQRTQKLSVLQLPRHTTHLMQSRQPN